MLQVKIKLRSVSFSIFLLIIFFSSCRRTQYAYFNLSNYNPSVGEQVTCTEVTEDASQYEWQVDGTVYSAERNPVFIFNQGGQHLVKLIVGKGRKKSERSQTVNVKAQASLIFWQGSTEFVYPVGISVNNINKAISGSCTPIPLCGEGNGATYTVNAGEISYFAIEAAPGTRSWSGTLTATQNSCTAILLN